MSRPWERSHEERRKTQKRPVRGLLIGAYAPREPAVIESILKFLQYERKYPLALVHRVMDRLASMTMGTTVVTHEEVKSFIREMPDDFAIARGPCACRLHTAETLGPDARDLPNGDLSFCRQSPLNVDIQIARCGEKFGELDTYERISKEDLLALEDECRDLGLVSNIYMIMGGEAGICHCSSATCAPFMANQALGGRSSIIRKGAFVAQTDPDTCNASGPCVSACHFFARTLTRTPSGPALSVDLSKCYGCGLCAAVCPEKAVTMVPRGKEKGRGYFAGLWKKAAGK
ncbi:MAG: 4Fe-4S dicluster domain-containing protein [Pseudomonadota bacterium]